MKIRRFLGLITLAFLTLGVNAQVKIGHINSQELLAAMPETDSAEAQLKKLAKDYELIIEEMQVELNKKYEDYLTKMKDTDNPMSELIRSSKEAELAELQQKIQKFNQDSQLELQQKQRVLLQPIQTKALNAVKEVAAEQGFTYILDEGTGTIAYKSPEAHDILPLVKKKLGLK